MSESSRYHDMSDEDLESLISALPRRVPRPTLREDILSQAPRQQARRAMLFRPAFALAALVVLLAVDLLVVRWQDGSVDMPRGPWPMRSKTWRVGSTRIALDEVMGHA